MTSFNRTGRRLPSLRGMGEIGEIEVGGHLVIVTIMIVFFVVIHFDFNYYRTNGHISYTVVSNMYNSYYPH